MKKSSVIDKMNSVKKALAELSEAWDDNIENVNLNELNSIDQYPFGDDLEQLILSFANWAETTEEEITNDHYELIDGMQDIDGEQLEIYADLSTSRWIEHCAAKLINENGTTVKAGEYNDIVEWAYRRGYMF